MSPRRFLGRASADRQALAAHVIALTQKAIQLEANLEREAAQPEAVANDPLQIELDWTNQFAMRICNDQELATAVAQSGGKKAESSATAAFLTSLAQAPIERELSQPPLLEALDHLAAHFPNFSEVVEFIRMRTALARLQPRSPLLLPPILLDGPPGIGKTAFARALAYALDVPLLTLQMSHATGSFDLAGLDPKFSNGGPGLLARTVALGRAVDPLVLLDEIDKVSGDRTHDPLGPLYALLEPSTAKTFIDDGLKLPLNLSHVRWLCTTNDVTRLHPAIASRCQIFRVAAPNVEQGRVIASNVYAALVRKHPWGRHFMPTLPQEVAEFLACNTPRELTRALLNALGQAALTGRKSLAITDFPNSLPTARRIGFV